MLTHVDVNPRPDNGEINSSPVTAPIPVEKFYKGCEYVLPIPGELRNLTLNQFRKMKGKFNFFPDSLICFSLN